MGTSWPTAEPIDEGKFKFFFRVNPGGALEHFETETVTTAIYYEVMYAVSRAFVLISFLSRAP